MSDIKQGFISTPAHVPDLIDDYRRRYEALQAETRELERLRADVFGAADRAAADIVSNARASIRTTIVNARRELSELAATIQAISEMPGQTTPAEELRAFRSARHDVRRLLDVARPELDNLREAGSVIAASTPVPSAANVSGSAYQHESDDAPTVRDVTPSDTEYFQVRPEPRPTSDEDRKLDTRPNLLASGVAHDSPDPRAGEHADTSEDLSVHDRLRRILQTTTVDEPWNFDTRRDPAIWTEPLPASGPSPQFESASRFAPAPTVAAPFARFGSDPSTPRSAKPWIAGGTLTLFLLLVFWWAQSRPSVVAGGQEEPNAAITFTAETSDEQRAALTSAAEEWMNAYYGGDAGSVLSVAGRDVKINDSRTANERPPAGVSDVRRTIDDMQPNFAGDGAVVSARVTERGTEAGQERSYISHVSQVWLSEAGTWRLLEARIVGDAALR